MPPQNAMAKLGIALVLWIVAWVINPFGLVGLAGTIFSVLGCIDWAKSKGLSPWFGALGLLTILGWVIMFVIPSRATLTSPPQTH